MSAATCRSCHAPIVWAVNAKTGKRLPLDKARPTVGNVVHLDGGRRWTAEGMMVVEFVPAPGVPGGYVSHFATCPNAGSHRRS